MEIRPCQALCRNNTPCLNNALPESDYCWLHEQKIKNNTTTKQVK